MMKVKEVLHEMEPYKPGKPIEETEREYGLHHVVKLASNENPYGCSQEVYREMQQMTCGFELYPDANATSLRQDVAEKWGVDEQQLVFGNGSDELITVISRTFLERGTNTVVPTPSFPQYAHNARIEGAEVKAVPLLPSGDHDVEGMLEAIDQQTRILWICNPNNPTGNMLEEEALYAFIQRIPSDVLVVLDEAYYEYIADERRYNPIPWLSEFPNLLMLRTFSKAYGLAAFRVGYGIGHPSVIGELNKVRNPFNNNRPAHKAAQVALQDTEFIEHCRTMNESEKARFVDFAKRHELHIYPSSTNFVLMESPADDKEVAQQLLERGIIVRAGHLLGTPGYLRITIGRKEQNDVLFEQLEQLMNEEGNE